MDSTLFFDKVWDLAGGLKTRGWAALCRTTTEARATSILMEILHLDETRPHACEAETGKRRDGAA